MMKNKKSESLAMNKIIVIILIVLVIALVIFFMYRESLWDYFKNLPGYTVNQTDKEVDYSSITPDQLSKYECIPIGTVVYSSTGVTSDNYIQIGDVKTNLYLGESSILLDIGNKNVNRLGFGEVVIMGSIENNIIKIDSKFLNENSQDYLQYKSLLPEIFRLKILDDAFRLGTNLLCQKASQVQEIKAEAGCVDSCEIHNGICKENGYENEINLGKIDCKDNQQCFVKKNEEKTEDNGLLLADFFSVYINPKIYPPGLGFLGKDSLDVEIGERQIISFSVYYPKTRSGGETEIVSSVPRGTEGKGFCYEIRSNDKISRIGYSKNEMNNGEATTSFATFNNNEKVFELVVWDPSVKPNPRVLKRVEIKPKSNPDFEGLTLLFNEKFKDGVLKKSEGKFYVVDALFKFENGLTVSTYRIDKYPDKIEIYGYYFISGDTGQKSSDFSPVSSKQQQIQSFDDNKNKWYSIDCYTGFIGFVSIGVNLDKIENSLTETILKNKCKLKY